MYSTCRPPLGTARMNVVFPGAGVCHPGGIGGGLPVPGGNVCLRVPPGGWDVDADERSLSTSYESTCPGQRSRPCARGPERRRRPDFFVQIPGEKGGPSRDVAIYKLTKADPAKAAAAAARGAGPRGAGPRGSVIAPGPGGSVCSAPPTPLDPPAPDSYVLRIKRRCGSGCEESEQLELELKAPPPPPKEPAQTQVKEGELEAPPAAAKGKNGKKGKGGKKGKKK